MTDSSSTDRNWNGRRRGWRALLLVVAVLVTGAVAYNTGVNQGAAQATQAAQAALAAAQASPATPGAQLPPPYPYYPPYPYLYGHRPWGMGLFSPLLFLLFWFVVLRAFVWGGPWRRHYRGGGPDWAGRADEWHRQAHERMGNLSSAGGSSPAGGSPQGERA